MGDPRGTLLSLQSIKNVTFAEVSLSVVQSDCDEHIYNIKAYNYLKSLKAYNYLKVYSTTIWELIMEVN